MIEQLFEDNIKIHGGTKVSELFITISQCGDQFWGKFLRSLVLPSNVDSFWKNGGSAEQILETKVD